MGKKIEEVELTGKRLSRIKPRELGKFRRLPALSYSEGRRRLDVHILAGILRYRIGPKYSCARVPHRRVLRSAARRTLTE